MVEVVGWDPIVQESMRVTCKACGAINQYIQSEVLTANYTRMGENSGHKYIVCANPKCDKIVRIPGTSW